jgi:hypothetical protein
MERCCATQCGRMHPQHCGPTCPPAALCAGGSGLGCIVYIPTAGRHGYDAGDASHRLGSGTRGFRATVLRKDGMDGHRPARCTQGGRGLCRSRSGAPGFPARAAHAGCGSDSGALLKETPTKNGGRGQNNSDLFRRGRRVHCLPFHPDYRRQPFRADARVARQRGLHHFHLWHDRPSERHRHRACCLLHQCRGPCQGHVYGS